MKHELRGYADAAETDQACARQILDWLREAIDERGLATLAISGGTSPRPMFESLAQAKFDWNRVHLFWVDERGVPPSDSQSNYRMANEAWLEPGGFPRNNIHRMEAERPAGEAALRYVADIRQFFGLSAGDLPQFDVIHLGMGPDAHTASLFPGDPLVEDRAGIAAALFAEKPKQWRITLLPGVLLAARHTAMLVTETDRAAVVRQVLQGPADPKLYPAQLASGEKAVWFVTAAVAKET